MKTEFKVLMWSDYYVDVNRLGKGIYLTSKPYLYPDNTTIESLIKVVENAGLESIYGDYTDNLKKCKLVPIKIVFQGVADKLTRK